MRGLDIKIELVDRVWQKQGLAFTVKVNQVAVMTWFQTETATGAEPTFTAIAEFGGEVWKIFGSDHTWKPEFENGKANDRLEVAQTDLFEVTRKAVEVMFGRALEVYTVDTDEGFDTMLDGEVVFQWRIPPGHDAYICFDPAGDYMFRMFSGCRHGFVPWEYGDTDTDEFEADSIDEISQLAYRTWNEGWIQR